MEVKLGSDINMTVKIFGGGPDVTGGGCFSARDNCGDNRGDTMLNNVLDFCILLPLLIMGLEGSSI